jgi:nitroreductase
VPTVLELTTDELLSTTRAVRRRLDLDRPVPRETVLDCLRLAVQAPSACNAKLLRFLVIDDLELRAELAKLYRRGYEVYLAQDFRAGNLLIGDADWDGAQRRIVPSVEYLNENLHRVPVLVIPCLERPVAGRLERDMDAALYGSAMPAAWSFCLAARSRGLGTVWTTMHLTFEREAAQLLGVDYETVQQLALFPVAYTKGTDFKPAYRAPIERSAEWRSA